MVHYHCFTNALPLFVFFMEGATSSPADDTAESFAFALTNGALGVFEVQGRRIHDFRYLLSLSLCTAAFME